MIIDAHCHYFTKNAKLDFVQGSSIEDHIKDCDLAGIDKFVLFTIGGLFRDFIESNDEIAAVANKFPSRIIPFGTINPWYEEESLEEINRCIKVLKLKGFKLHPWMTGFPINSDLMDTMMREISRFDVPVIIHSGTPRGQNLTNRRTRI